jgi:hypothetical protein
MMLLYSNSFYRWEATDALRKRLERSGIQLRGAPCGWAEFYRVFRECKVLFSFGNRFDSSKLNVNVLVR